MMNRFLQFATEYQPGDQGEVNIAIVGGGATRRRALRGSQRGGTAHTYGFKNLTTDSLG